LLCLHKERTRFNKVDFDVGEEPELQKYSNDIFHQSTSSWTKFNQADRFLLWIGFFGAVQLPSIRLREEVQNEETDTLAIK